MDWGNFFEEQAQALLGAKVDQAVAPASSKPVAMAPSGVQYMEGKPAAVQNVQGQQPMIFGMPKNTVLIGAAVLALGVGFFMLRK